MLQNTRISSGLMGHFQAGMQATEIHCRYTHNWLATGLDTDFTSTYEVTSILYFVKSPLPHLSSSKYEWVQCYWTYFFAVVFPDCAVKWSSDWVKMELMTFEIIPSLKGLIGTTLVTVSCYWSIATLEKCDIAKKIHRTPQQFIIFWHNKFSQGSRLTFQLASPVASDRFDSLAKQVFH